MDLMESYLLSRWNTPAPLINRVRWLVRGAHIEVSISGDSMQEIFIVKSS